MKKYEELELPFLPEPWVWECGDDDGDPCALLRRHGWCIRVHEGSACSYTADLAITVRPDREGKWSTKEVDTFLGGGTGGIPFRVFQAVSNALRQWYEVPEADDELLHACLACGKEDSETVNGNDFCLECERKLNA